MRCISPIVRRPSAAIASARSSPVTAASASACTTISDDVVPDRVVQLARDPQPLLGRGGLGQQLALARAPAARRRTT